jgi:hypothetical protein
MKFALHPSPNSHAYLEDLAHPAWVDPLVELCEAGFWCATVDGPWFPWAAATGAKLFS